MNDPITLAATQHEDRHGNPDTTVPDTRATTTAGPDTPDTPDGQDAPDDSDAQTTQRMRTLLETAATCRPVEEVTALVSLLKEDGPLPDAGHDALRAAAVTRPVQDVQLARLPRLLRGLHRRAPVGRRRGAPLQPRR
ncbi:hypothetical protein ACWCO4_31530, partial [Streptomyces virginiae]